MADRFVIVIEADNRRAHAAYLKGLADLDLIWPQLMHAAAERDAVTNAQVDSQEEMQKQEDERFWSEIEAYTSAHELRKQWERSPSFFKGPKPSVPFIPPMPPTRLPSVLRRDMARMRYESIRAELQCMANLAGAALGPYRMTERQVHEMIAWEDGSIIESLKRELDRHQQAEVSHAG